MTRAIIAAAIAHVTANAAGHATLRDSAIDGYARIILAEATRFELDPLILVAMVSRESDWKPRSVNADTGAVGLGQLMPNTDTTKGFDGYDLAEPALNLFLSARRLRYFMGLCRDDKWRAVDAYHGAGTKRKTLSPFAVSVRRIYEEIVGAEVVAEREAAE